MTKKQPEELVPNAEDLLQQVAELTNALQRERADAMNVRRRADEDKARLGTFYKSLVLRELLPVIDNFERALKSMPADLAKNDFMKGVQGVVKQFEAVLAKLGVERIKTVGEVFDPELHEAVSMEEGEGTHEVVSEELQAGYRLQDEILRHAMVKVKLQSVMKKAKFALLAYAIGLSIASILSGLGVMYVHTDFYHPNLNTPYSYAVGVITVVVLLIIWKLYFYFNN